MWTPGLRRPQQPREAVDRIIALAGTKGRNGDRLLRQWDSSSPGGVTEYDLELSRRIDALIPAERLRAGSFAPACGRSSCIACPG
jgi:hypothetical protein